MADRPHYYEYRSLGRWNPARVANAPVTTGTGKLCLLTANGPGQEVRCIKEIGRGHEHLTLLQLAEVYGTNGRFRTSGFAVEASG